MRYNSLEKRFKKLRGGSKFVTVKVEFQWDWEYGEAGNCWFNDDSRDFYERNEKIEKSLTEKYENKCRRFCDDIDKFIAAGGQWDYF